MSKKLDNRWVRTVDGKLTFCGVLELYFANICKANSWNAQSTIDAYIAYYNKRIIPNIANHDETPIDKIKLYVLDNALDSIAKEGKGKRKGVFVPYDASTLETFSRLIRVVIEEGAHQKLCSNLFYTVPKAPTGNNGGKEQRRKVIELTRKSLTIHEEKRLAEYLFSWPQAAKGEQVGVLMMYCFGLRNAESCAIKYGDLRRKQINGEEYTELMVYETYNPATKDLKAGGKTPNVGRIIPVPSRFLDYITERKKGIIDHFKRLEKSVDIDSLPIACKGKSYMDFSTPEDLNEEAKKAFERVGISSRVLKNISEDIKNNKVEMELKEKSPTAYLLRRNLVTIMMVLGLTPAEIQYIIGHDVEDQYETRNEFVSDEKKIAIKRKLDARPLVNDPSSCKPRMIRFEDDKSFSFDFRTDTVLEIKPKGKKLRIHMSAYEPMDPIKIKVHSKTAQNLNDAEIAIYEYDQEPSRDITLANHLKQALMEE